jgi:hypothetical protein
LLALTDSDPLVAVDVTGVSRNVAGLLEVTPGARLKIKAAVWNPSSDKLKAGKLRLHAAPGWFASVGEVGVGPIAAYDRSQEIAFEMAAPAMCAARTLRPIVLRYAAGKITSTPATELVWWIPAARK